MDKGQHLRLVIVEGSTPTNRVIALAVDLTVHFATQTEDSTTKDSSDTSGNWAEFDVTGRSGDIQFSALLGVGSDTGGKSFADWINQVSDEQITWKLMFASGTNNRTLGKTVCSGKGKLVNLSATGTDRQKATYSGTLNMYGPVTVGND